MATQQIGSQGRNKNAQELRVLFLFVLHFTLTVLCLSASSSVVQDNLWIVEDKLKTKSEYDKIQRHLRLRREVSDQTEAVTRSSFSLSLPPSCFISCQGVKQRPVCASNGITYSSKCELRRLRDCDKLELRVISKGRCPGETKCQEERRSARYELLQRPGQDIYMPECKEDGSFMETQCHVGTGYCWCVRSDGKPIPGSSVEGQNTNCQKMGRGSKNSSGSKHRRGVGGCSPIGRSIFNQNLIRRFNEEYARAPKSTQPTTASSSKLSGVNVPTQCQGDAESCAQRRVIEWKFSELDLDKDMELKRKELKTLRYLVNKIVEPQACALSFPEYCDWDNNNKIALNEWLKCLRVVHPVVNVTNQANSKKKVSSTNQKFQKDKHLPRIVPGPSKAINIGGIRPLSLSPIKVPGRIPLQPQKATFYGLKSRTSVTIANTRKGPQESEQKQHQQQGRGSSEGGFKLRPCDDAHQKAKDMDKADPDGHIFIPECESNGLFKKAQCHNSTGYCWCVDERTGIPIPGISTHNVTPDCSDVKTNSLKGCPFLTKKRFLTELLDHITQEMVERANNGTATSQLNEPDPEQSIEERAVRWKMSTMDTNHNGVLEKGEVRDFREEIKHLKGEEKYMRKCRRNFLQYCDEDDDSKITLDEWVNCLGLNEQPKNLPENPKRNGKNPFSNVLKS